MKTSEDFYSERDLRTLEYVGNDKILNTSVFIAIEERLLEFKSGQILLLSLLNQVCRVHRKVYVRNFSDKLPLKIQGLFLNANLKSEALAMMNAIDPYGDHQFSDVPNSGDIVLAAGNFKFEDAIHIGYEGSIAAVSDEIVKVECELEGSMRGAALAACLGASSLFQKTLYGKFPKFDLSIWNLRQGTDAAKGPDLMNSRLPAKILAIGGGAIGVGLGYWCRIFEKKSNWTLIEKDEIKLHNTNRGLLFFPKETNFFGDDPTLKAKVFQKYVEGTTIHENWLHEVNLENASFDAVLCLANEFGVRRLVNFINSPILFQATTGKSWLAQLHKHVLGKDDCVFCRTGEIAPIEFGCSTVAVKDSNGQSDAALPFLSALSSLALIVALEQVNEISEISVNDWRIDLKSGVRQVSYGKRKCKESCDIIPFLNAIKPTLA